MTDVNAMYDTAIKLKDSGDLAGAVTQLEAIEAIDPKHILTHSALAVILQRLGRLDDAIAHAFKVTELEPEDPFSFTQMSVIYQRCGKIQEAEDAMARARMMEAARGGQRH
ncbi:MAG TPA: tetratricopeptide repeat protein [Planctomycetaceae bacterium]|jgi:Flp pilus assembly protein TadD|nr:tetratricopeptide repeat protein [Planctomycetaceae bacterium]